MTLMLTIDLVSSLFYVIQGRLRRDREAPRSQGKDLRGRRLFDEREPGDVRREHGPELLLLAQVELRPGLRAHQHAVQYLD